MPEFVIKQDLAKCIGCGFCVALCPGNWKMADSKSKPIKTEVTSIGCNKTAAENCPVQCIKIIKR